MRILLDSHTFLWFVLRKPQLSCTADALAFDPLPRNVVIGSHHGVDAVCNRFTRNAAS